MNDDVVLITISILAVLGFLIGKLGLFYLSKITKKND